MTSIRLTKIIVLLISLICSIHTVGQPSLKVTEQTLSQLNKFRLDYAGSMLNKKPDLLQAYLADNIRLMPPFQKTVLGKSNAELYFKAFSNRFTIHEFTRKEMEILDLGSQVMEIGTFTMRLTLKSATKEQILVGKYLDLWEEQKNGEVILVTASWNFDEYYGDFHELLKFDEVPAVYMAMQPNVQVKNNISFELAALNRLLDATVTQHDGNTWSLYYSDDAMLLASYYPACIGKKSIDDYIRGHVKELPVFEELDIRNDHIDDLGPFIVEYASHIASWKNGDSSGVSMGKNIRVWRRGSDHSLKLFRSIGMYD
ncbi:MAG: hypothetical protein C0490_04360 [Marivirga sp.]|nr:hypothetical protein [Marivirga sp.]